jgi:hypothetical protein
VDELHAALGADEPGALTCWACEHLGEAAAIALVVHHGGRNLYVPTPDRMGDGHILHRLLGASGARRLCEQWAGETVWVPSPSRLYRLIGGPTAVWLEAEGRVEPGTVARMLRLTPRQVRRIASEKPQAIPPEVRAESKPNAPEEAPHD